MVSVTDMLNMYSKAGVFDGGEERKVVSEIAPSMNGPGMKVDYNTLKLTCDTCGETKFATEFKKKYNRGEFHSSCKKCESNF